MRLTFPAKDINTLLFGRFWHNHAVQSKNEHRKFYTRSFFDEKGHVLAVFTELFYIFEQFNEQN